MSISFSGFRTVRIEKLILPGGISALRDKEFVAELGASYEYTAGQPAEPILIDSKMRLRAGKHRVAACLNRGLKTIGAMVFDGDEADLARLTDVENAIRRHDPAERDAALARIVGHPIEKPEPREDSAQPKKGRPVTEKGKAIRKVAKELGKTPKAVDSAIRRHEERQQPPTPPEPPTPKPAPTVETWGLDVPEDVLQAIAAMTDGLASLASGLRKSLAELTALENATGRQLIRLKDGLLQALYECKAETPKAICPACKLVPLVRSKCNTCCKRGYVGEAMLKGLADELKAVGVDSGVYYEGHWYTMEQVASLKE